MLLKFQSVVLLVIPAIPMSFCPAFCARQAGNLFAAPGESNQPRSASVARTHLIEAQHAPEGHHLQEAKARLEQAIRADPKLAEAHLMLGIVEFQRGDNSVAVEHFRRALELEPDSFDGHYNLALTYLREQRLQDGAKELEQAVALHPGHVDAAYNLGVVLLELGRPNEALPHLRRVRLGSQRADVAFNIVRAELAASRFGEAQRLAESEAKFFGEDPHWRASVGRLFLEYNQPREAELQLEAALRLKPDSIETRRQLATAYLQTREPARALASLGAGKGAQDHFLAATPYLSLRRLPEALQESEQALKQEPREPRFLLQHARIDQRLGRQQEALEILRQVSELEPQWAEPHYSAGVSYYFLRRYADARHSLDRALELDGDSVRALFLYAATLANEGRNREGEERLLRAIARDPANARFQYHLGAIRLRDNRPLEAQQAFEKSIQLKPDYAWPHYQLGKLLASSGQLDLAVGELQTAVRCQPDLAQAFYHLGRVYARLGEREKSQQALATFSQFKKQEADEDREFMEGVQKDLELGDR